MNKDEISEALEDERERFLELIDDLDDEVIETAEIIPGWTIKDILAHVSAWEAELIKLLWQAKQGQKPTTIHFRNPSVDVVNQEWHTQMKNRDLDRVLEDYQTVRKQTLRRLEGFTEKELNDPMVYPWLKKEPLWKWIASDSFEHEAEHREQIANWRRRVEGKEPPVIE